MPQDIEDAVVFALAQKGKPYRTNSERFGDAAFDCSGLVIRSLAEAGIPLPNGISVEKKWGNSVSLWRWAKDVGGLVTVERAVRIRGAILIRGRWYGNGPLGDVKFSLGDGRQTGAGSRRTGVATTDVRQGFFHDGFIIPGYAAWDCEKCGREVRRFRGSRSAECHDCGAQYSISGQRYRDNWRDNPSERDGDVGDMEGFEMAALRQESEV